MCEICFGETCENSQTISIPKETTLYDDDEETICEIVPYDEP